MADRLTLMTVHAHPDDEVFATGGVLSKYAAEGLHTVNICCTGGEEGEIVDPTMDVAAVQLRLHDVRKEELEAACAILGVETLEWLGYRDSGMAGTDANQNPASFHRANLDEATGRLVRLVRQYRPHVLVSYDENGSYGHPDHIKAYQITGQAFDAAGDPARYPEAGTPWQPLKLYMCGISVSHIAQWRRIAEELNLDTPWLRDRTEDEGPRGMPDERITTRVLVKDYAERKIAALRAHRTQIAPDFFLYNIPPEFLQRAFQDEEFARVRSLIDSALPENDLFAGLR